MINLRYGESKRSASRHFEQPVTRPKKLKVEIAAQESADGGYSQRSRSRELRQSRQTEPSKGTATKRAEVARITGGLVPAQVAQSMTTARVMVFEGGTSVKSEMSDHRTMGVTQWRHF